MPSHRIHLRGPWEYLWREATETSSDPATLTGVSNMPKEWAELFGSRSGTAEFHRKFHKPTNLDPHERVMLILTEARGAGQVLLNGTLVGPFTASGNHLEFEITTLLNPFNELTVEISFDASVSALPGGLFGVVALEIRSEY